MSFAAPIWLILLAPWGLLAIWLLLGQRNRVAVPFLPLWDSTQAAPKTKRSIRPPPLAIWLMLVAMLLAIIGAAGPQWGDPFDATSAIVIVDRGIRMSLSVRWASEVQRAADLLHARGFRELAFKLYPNEEIESFEPPVNVKPLALEEVDLFAKTTAALADKFYKKVVVVSDQSLYLGNDRFASISPAQAVNNVGIVSLSARATPKAQVMVRVRNQSDLRGASLTVKSADASQTQQIKLPEREGEANFFVDLPSMGEIVEVKLDAADDLPVDNVAWLVRQRTWPKLDVIDPLPPEVQRMVDVYRENRPAAASSASVVVANDVAHLPASRPGIVFASNASAAKADPAQIAIMPHELTRDVDWRELAANAIASTLPSNDWTPLVRTGDRVLLAVREKDRQAFIGFDAHAAASSAQFVVLCGKLFDWAGQGGDVYATDRVHRIDDAWKLVQTDDSTKRYDPPLPGVYRRADGALLAMSALDVRFDAPIKTDLQKLDRLAKERTEWMAFRPALLGLSMIALFVALVLLNPRR